MCCVVFHLLFIEQAEQVQVILLQKCLRKSVFARFFAFFFVSFSGVLDHYTATFGYFRLGFKGNGVGN